MKDICNGLICQYANIHSRATTREDIANSFHRTAPQEQLRGTAVSAIV